MFALTKAKTAVPRTYLPRADFNKKLCALDTFQSLLQAQKHKLE